MLWILLRSSQHQILSTRKLYIFTTGHIESQTEIHNNEVAGTVGRLTCSRIAHDRNVLAERAQLQAAQPPCLRVERRAKGASITNVEIV